MMGLLGEGWDDPKSTAILQMASGLMSTRNPGMALSRGIQGYQQAMNDAEERKWTKQEREYLLSERKRKEQEALDAQMRSSKIRGLLSDAFSPVSSSQAIGLDGAGPTAEKASLIGQQKPVNYQQLAAQIVSMGGDPSALKTIAESANYGRNKVARTVKGMGPDGREYEYQVDDFGQKVGDGLAQYRAPIMQDLGGKVAALDPYKLTPVTQFHKSMSPDAQASNAVAWANNALSRERLNFDKQGGAKPQFNADLGGFVLPPSQSNPQGQFIPLQGAGQSQKPLTESEAKASLYLGQMRSANDVLAQLDARDVKSSPEAVRLANSFIGNYTTSSGAQQIAQAQNQWSEAYLRAKTGAAATEGEVKLNNATFFPQPGDSSDVIAQKAQARKQAELDMTLPAGRGANRLMTAPSITPAKPANNVPMVGQVVDGYKFKGGNPADPASWEKQ